MALAFLTACGGSPDPAMPPAIVTPSEPVPVIKPVPVPPCPKHEDDHEGHDDRDRNCADAI